MTAQMPQCRRTVIDRMYLRLVRGRLILGSGTGRRHAVLFDQMWPMRREAGDRDLGGRRERWTK